MGGCFNPSKEQLIRIRYFIGDHIPKFQELINSKEFLSMFGQIKGESHKRMPGEFVALSKQEPLIMRKQFYYFTLVDAYNLQADDLLDSLLRYYQSMRPLNHFLTEAMNIENFAPNS